MGKKVFITRRIPEEGILMLREKGFTVVMSDKNRPLTKREIIKTLKNNKYDAVISLLTDPIDKEVISSAPSVKIYSNYAVGFNNIDINFAKEKGVVIANTPGGSTERVAEHTFALILSLACRVVEGFNFVKQGKYLGWDPMLLWGNPIMGSTLGIVGGGRIGERVAEMGNKGFGMNIVYYDLVKNESMEKNLNAKKIENLDELFSISDIISLHCPLNNDTYHLVSEKRLRVMKKNAYLINTARGPVVDEEALYRALKEKRLAGAGLDVFEHEPKIYYGLKKLPNVIFTPHIASATEETRLSMSRMCAENIIQLFEGKTVVNRVN